MTVRRSRDPYECFQWSGVSSTQEGFKHAAKHAAFWRAVPFSSALRRRMKMGMFVHLTGEWMPGWRARGWGGLSLGNTRETRRRDSVAEVESRADTVRRLGGGGGRGENGAETRLPLLLPSPTNPPLHLLEEREIGNLGHPR